MRKHWGRMGMWACCASLLWSFASRAGAVTIYSSNYFVAEQKYTCTAADHANPNTWIRQQWKPGTCGGFLGVYVTKGQGTYPFGSEVFFENTTTGYFEISSEVSSRVSNGRVSQFRVFRNPVTLTKGMPWLPISFNSVTGKSWVSSAWLEYWTDSNGAPSCNATVNAAQDWFQSNLDLVEYVGVWPSWIQDRRGGSPNPNAWHDVEVIKKTGIWGSNPQITEIYYYGRFMNPTTHAWEPIGLVKFEVYEGSTLTVSSSNNKIVGCTGTILCGSCPP